VGAENVSFILLCLSHCHHTREYERDQRQHERALTLAADDREQLNQKCAKLERDVEDLDQENNELRSSLSQSYARLVGWFDATTRVLL
jgi:septal ring factor EnvC (AmiA/AmiB activator)